jgi:hypothetical protein
LSTEDLAAAAAKKLEHMNFVQEDQPPWKQYRPMGLTINRLTKTEAKREVIDFLSSFNPQEDLVIYTDGSAHAEEGLGAAAVTEDGKFSHLCFLGPPGKASNVECKLVGI